MAQSVDPNKLAFPQGMVLTTAPRLSPKGLLGESAMLPTDTFLCYAPFGSNGQKHTPVAERTLHEGVTLIKHTAA